MNAGYSVWPAPHDAPKARLTVVRPGFTRMRVFPRRTFSVIKIFWGTAMDLRIMVVEDSETTRRIIRAILETREWRICEIGRAHV